MKKKTCDDHNSFKNNSFYLLPQEGQIEINTRKNINLLVQVIKFYLIFIIFGLLKLTLIILGHFNSISGIF